MITISIHFIWFDLGYTLVYLDREKRYQQKLLNFGINKSLEELQLAYHLADKFFMREHPGLLGKKREVYAQHYHQVLHHYLEIEEIPEITSQLSKSDGIQMKWKPFPATIPILQELKDLGYGIGLISNWDKTADQVLTETGIKPYLDHVVISSDLQVEKPDERIFHYALSQADISPDQCLYVGDNYYDDVIGSRKVGMQSIVINPYGKKGIEELEDITIISNIKDLLSILPTKVIPSVPMRKS